MTQRFRAVILDLDGVLTRTAALHARAWKQTFDSFLAQRAPTPGEDHSPFDVRRDYREYVDGRPRLDGIRSFLAARGIALPDTASREGLDPQPTVESLGQTKNELFHELLARDGVETFPDAVEQLRVWRERGVRTALITSSRNGRAVLDAAGLQSLFDVIIDGNDAARLGIRGKPAPDVFVHAARALDVQPAAAIVVEDALSGVEAARAGGFGLVVGVARADAADLAGAGAHVVVDDLRALDRAAVVAPTQPADAMERIVDIESQLHERELALFLDYDGTLTPIVRRPEEATLGDSMRALLHELARRCTVAIVSGRDLADVRAMVGLNELYYAGSHGFDVSGPDGMRMEQQDALQHVADLDAAEHELNGLLRDLDGVWVERKRFAIAVHFREAAPDAGTRVQRAVEQVRAKLPRLRAKGGKKIMELQPDIPWDKGRAVCWLLEELGLARRDVLAVYIGDDVTDEDAFAALAPNGIGIRVGAADEPTHAQYVLRDTAALERFGRMLLELLARHEARDA